VGSDDEQRRDALDRTRLIYRWDLDKTYLRTEFDTVRQLLRTAFEAPGHKRTVPGAAALLRELHATEPAGIYILSGSPEQMRRVLEAKLRLDGVRWDAFTLKPSLKNLLRGRFRFLKDQVGYKLAALLAARAGVSPDTDEVLFGDDAEADAFVYSLYSDICAGLVGNDTLMAVLDRARVYPDDIPRLVRLASRVPRRAATRWIFIHLDRVSPAEVFEELGRRVCPFHNYFQPALVLLEDRAIDAPAALRVGADMVIDHAFSPDALTASFLDVAGRGYVGSGAAGAIIDAIDAGGDLSQFGPVASVLAAFAADLRRRVVDLAPPLALEDRRIDYVAQLSRDKARARAARKRAVARRE
jgi:hypothetical protein